MSRPGQLTDAYELALRAHVASAEELGLQQAYELGRRAIAEGLGVLDLAAVHQRAASAMVTIQPTAFAAAMAFFSESLSTYEMLHRSVRDTNERLQQLNGELKDKNERLSAAEQALRAANEQLEQRVVERTKELTAANAALKAEAEERRAVEEQLRHAQRMDAIGQLAGGVAHDFNNLLTVVLSYAHLLRNDRSLSAEVRSDLDEISRAGERAAALTRQLLAFSRKQVLEPTVLDLNEVIQHMDKMFHRLLGEDIELVSKGSPSLGRVVADRGQVEQVLLNLVVNARDAMPSGGQLTIETSNVHLDAAYAGSHMEVKPGLHVMLAVSDTGVGMDKATQARIFEPFFTTKEKGKGTGLGLSTVFGIVKQSGGSVWVYSEPGQGTTFKVYLPCLEGDTRVDASGIQSEEPLTGTETILLAEDEEQVRRLVSSVLRRCGYNVIEARNGREALEICDSHAGRIDLLLTDVVMPELGGRHLSEQLIRNRAEMKTLYMSGYTDDAVVRHGVLSAAVAFLQKPITPDSLMKKVRSVLSGKT